MSIQRPSTLDETGDAIAHGRPFQGSKINGETIAVLDGQLHRRPMLTGPLAPEVLRTMADYSEQYLTGGGRERAPWHVIYYVTAPVADPEGRAVRRVLGYVTAARDMRTTTPEGTISARLLDSIGRGLIQLRGQAEWLASDGGDYPTQPEGHHDGEGCTFVLWERSTREAIQNAAPSDTFTDRHAAHLARNIADDLRNGRHAWITRHPEGYTPAATWGEEKGR